VRRRAHAAAHADTALITIIDQKQPPLRFIVWC
jgi:hypothetical protein